jgi:hypothetical protein
VAAVAQLTKFLADQVAMVAVVLAETVPMVLQQQTTQVVVVVVAETDLLP